MFSRKRSKPIQHSRRSRLKVETLEKREMLTGDVAPGGVFGLRADIDGSGTVDFADFLVISTNFGTTSPDGDINIDGKVDFHDFNILAHNFGQNADIPTARVQILHNSPYAAAAEVDVYLDGGLLGPLDDFGFRSATPYIDVPAGVDVQIDIAAPNSEDNSAAIFSRTVVLEEGKTYAAIAVGDPGQTAGVTAFDLAITDMARETVETTDNTEFMVFHGAPDAPTVDVIARDVGTLVDDISFREFTNGYTSVASLEYTLDITPGGDNQTVVASYTADLTGASNEVLIVAASGFLSPATDADPAFELLAVFPDGTTALLPSATAAPEAQLQIVHNSPFAAAAVVDVYVNDELLLDDFSFRDATPFVNVPAFIDLEIDITAADATDSSSPVFTKTVALEGSGVYVAMASGDPTVMGAGGFDLFVSDAGQTAASSESMVDFLVYHGSPDAPTVDIVARDIATLVDDISYTEFTGYASVGPAVYTLDITGADNDTVVASYGTDLSTLTGQALVVAASGFLAPSSDADPGFGLLAVFPDGTTALLPAA